MCVTPGVTAGDLVRHRLIVSSRMWENHVFEGWHGLGSDKLDIAASYNLVTAARQLMEAGAGVVLTFDGLVRPLENQCFVPLTPPLHAAPYLIRRRSAPVAAPVRVFLDALNALCDGRPQDGPRRRKKRSRALKVLLRFGGAFVAGIRRDYFRPNTSSAICTAFVAAPLRIWSAQQKSVSERLKEAASAERSRRTRPT